MLKRIGRLFVIKTRLEAYAVIYAIALGATHRGKTYLEIFPGVSGWILFAACCAVVFMAGAVLLDHVRAKAEATAKPNSHSHDSTGQ